ncbi:MAG: DUF3429 domain-containing protein [Pseudomonadota bacterium]
MKIIHEDTNRAAWSSYRAQQLGYAGVLPFAFGAVVQFMSPGVFTPLFADQMAQWVMLYGAIILSFMAGSRWGAAVLQQRTEALGGAVLPALIGWAALIPSGVFGLTLAFEVRLGILTIAFIFLLVTEMLKDHWPRWYLNLRIRLTILVAFFLLLLNIGWQG